MSFQFSKTTAILAAAGLLSACSSIANKSPDEMVRYGVQRNLVHDNQYNFSGQYRLKVIPATPARIQASQTRQAALQAQQSTDEAIQAAAQVPSQTRTRHKNKVHSRIKQQKTAEFDRKLNQAEYDNVAYERTALHYYLQNVQQVLTSHITAPYSGAVDLRRGRIEVVPQVRYETRNALAEAQLPIQASIPDMAVVIDPGAVAPWWDAYAKVTKPEAVIGDKYLAIQVPRQDYQNLPLKQLVRAVPKAVDDGYAAIDKRAFTQLPMDEDGRRAGAHYHVRLSVTPQQSEQITQVMLNSLSQQLQRDEANSREHAQGKTADYASMQNLLQKIGQFLQVESSDNSEVVQKLRQQPVVTDFYLDRRGRIMAMRQTLNLTPLARFVSSGSQIYATSWTQLDYTAHPKFVLKPDAANTLDLTQKALAMQNAPKNGQSIDSADQIIQKLLDLQREHPDQIRVKVHN
ncbi:hypothetical protein PT286_03415 [Neisseriaceae bacterium ESL0693]|nr:hypothetical protein [Neisseriaceae bacterium ESL0693]